MLHLWFWMIGHSLRKLLFRSIIEKSRSKRHSVGPVDSWSYTHARIIHFQGHILLNCLIVLRLLYYEKLAMPLRSPGLNGPPYHFIANVFLIEICNFWAAAPQRCYQCRCACVGWIFIMPIGSFLRHDRLLWEYSFTKFLTYCQNLKEGSWHFW